jgi:hypothetical protein
MRFAVESWAPEYGSPTEVGAVLDPAEGRVDPWVERDAAGWAPIAPAPGTERLEGLAFVDGVRRVEANVWITAPDGAVHQGICPRSSPSRSGEACSLRPRAPTGSTPATAVSS